MNQTNGHGPDHNGDQPHDDTPRYLPELYESAEDWARRRFQEEQRRIEEEFGIESDRLERMQRAYEMHLMDIPTREIGAQLGVSHMTAWRDIREFKMFCARSVLNPAERLGSHLAECSTIRTVVWRDLRRKAISSTDATKALMLIQRTERELLDLDAYVSKVDEYELMDDSDLAAHG